MDDRGRRRRRSTRRQKAPPELVSPDAVAAHTRRAICDLLCRAAPLAHWFIREQRSDIRPDNMMRLRLEPSYAWNDFVKVLLFVVRANENTETVPTGN